jgi:hypothetical protein
VCEGCGERCGRVFFCGASSSRSGLRLRVAALRKYQGRLVVEIGVCCLVFHGAVALGKLLSRRANSCPLRHACTYRLDYPTYALAYHNTTNSKPSRDGPPICRIRCFVKTLLYVVTNARCHAPAQKHRCVRCVQGGFASLPLSMVPDPCPLNRTSNPGL